MPLSCLGRLNSLNNRPPPPSLQKENEIFSQDTAASYRPGGDHLWVIHKLRFQLHLFFYVYFSILCILGHSQAKDYPVNQSQNCTLSHSNLTEASCRFPLSLEEQIIHKKVFLEEHIPPKSKVILIGHSIGAYIILQLLKNCHRASDVTKGILLFPTIERMAISPSGRYVTPMVTYFKWLALSAVTAFSILPECVKKGLVRWWFSNRKKSSHSSVDSVLKLLTPQSINGCLTMAGDEMKEVVNPDEEVQNHIVEHNKQIIPHESTPQ